jgi:putative YphP/YqiW family bacilliredoxin
MPYDPVMVQPMRDELTEIGFEELLDEKEVDAFFAHKTGTSFLLINSVCGCAAGMARPSVKLALAGKGPKPDRIATVFAGQDLEATQKARGYLPGHPPSSPSMALLRNGKVVHFVPRHAIEGRAAQDIAGELADAFEKHCG